MRTLRTVVAWGLAITALGAASAPPGAATAQEAKASGAQCTLSGSVAPPSNLEIYDAASGGSSIARLTGAKTQLVVSDFPANPSQQRLAIKTGSGTGSFRIEGYVDASKLPLYTKRSVSVVGGNVWLAPNYEVDFVGARGDKLQLRRKLTYPIRQSFTTWAPCNAVSLEKGTPAGYSPEGNARGYIVKKDSVDLYDGWKNGSLVTTLYRAPESEGILLWSTERKGMWVHVKYHGQVILDAWVKVTDLRPLPYGETMDTVAPPITRPIPPRLALKSEARVVKATKEVPIKLSPKEDAAVIGKIEPDTEVYVLDVMVGHASVMPKSLNIAPTGDDQFWVVASDLGL